MNKDDYKDGMEIIVNGRKCIANDLELCNDGSYVVHVAFPAKDNQWRVPIDKVEVAK